MFNVEFTNDERTALLQLIDLAVKAGGLGVAEASLVLANKIKAATETVATPAVAPTEDK